MGIQSSTEIFKENRKSKNMEDKKEQKPPSPMKKRSHQGGLPQHLNTHPGCSPPAPLTPSDLTAPANIWQQPHVRSLVKTAQPSCPWTQVKVTQSCPTLCNAMDYTDQNTGVGSLSLLQGIFPRQGLNPGLWHCRWILYQLPGKPLISFQVTASGGDVETEKDPMVLVSHALCIPCVYGGTLTKFNQRSENRQKWRKTG